MEAGRGDGTSILCVCGRDVCVCVCVCVGVKGRAYVLMWYLYVRELLGKLRNKQREALSFVNNKCRIEKKKITVRRNPKPVSNLPRECISAPLT